MMRYIFILPISFLTACGSVDFENTNDDSKSLFTLLSSDVTRIKFNNQLTEGLNTNVMMYEYFYNGGGVAIGDVNNDNLDDIYFTSNMTPNKLYLNRGNMRFEDITELAGVSGRSGPWKTGTSMVDVNGDGLLDILLNYSGKVSGRKRIKQLFINKGNDANGNPIFLDEAQRFGLADSSFTTQTVFFDYDHDNDLDALFVNHNPKRINNLDDKFISNVQKEIHPTIGVKLFQNNNDYFYDVTSKTGLISTALSYGLAAGVSDVNNDGWPDLYLSHDYDVPDYLYINNKDGTFTDELDARIGHTSHFSMGNDIADINNDGLQDILTLDMLPQDNHRQKLLLTTDNYNSFDLRLRSGFHHQYMRNMLHLNNGDGTFSEIGQLAGVSNTDWSWAPLFADFDNDGFKDLLVTNGYVRDYTNLDFMKYAGDHLQKKKEVFRTDLLELVQKMPSSNVINYLFRNNGNLTFSNVSSDWGMKLPSNSNGAAYSDLDNDGDLDIVINNLNQEAFIYRNDASSQGNLHYLKVQLVGDGKNVFGLGSKVSLYTRAGQQILEEMPTRGYQSSVSHTLHFGLGNQIHVDSLIVKWPSGKRQTLKDFTGDTLITLKSDDALKMHEIPLKRVLSFSKIKSPVPYVNKENLMNDFKRQPLLLNPLSFSGPCMTMADVNNDNLLDLFVGGGSGQSSLLYIQRNNGAFVEKSIPAFQTDKNSEDTDALFIDVNNDGYKDLYVASGGYHQFSVEDNLLQDRLYINDGKGNFKREGDRLPVMRTSTSCIRANDINGDGYLDLFVGGRVIPGRYPETPSSYILINDGTGYFKNETVAISDGIERLGMVTDASWSDLDNDGSNELIIVGDWMPITVFSIIKGKLVDQTSMFFDGAYSGWWNRICTGDFNKDGLIDIVVGNIGINTHCKVSVKEPAELYYKDFDGNGSVDPISCCYIQGVSYPYVTRDELLEQLGMMRQRFTTYSSYADATLTYIFKKEELVGAKHLMANTFKTSYFQSVGRGKLKLKELPVQAQFSAVYTISVLDFDGDGNDDLLLCGNAAEAKLRFGKYDANHGILLQGDGKGEFRFIPQNESGLTLKGDVRSVLNFGNTWLFGINQQALEAYQLNNEGR